MSVSLPRALAFLALLPVASCDLYIRADDGDVFAFDARPPIDAGQPIDARPIDATDAPPMPPPNPGFVTPTTTTRANVFRNGAWTEVGPADWSCLNQPAEPVPTTGYSVGGTVRDFASNTGVSAALRATAAGQALGSATTSGQGGARGVYRMEVAPLPAGASRVRFTVSGTGARTTVTMDRYLGPGGNVALDLPLMAESSARALPAFVGEMADPTDGLVVGDLRDCQGRLVSGAIVALSQQINLVAHWPGGVTFYFSAGNTSLPVRHTVTRETNRDGKFAVLGPQPLMGAEGSVQAWGFPTDADRASGTLRLLDRRPAVIEPSVVSAVQLGRLRLGIAQ